MNYTTEAPPRQGIRLSPALLKLQAALRLWRAGRSAEAGNLLLSALAGDDVDTAELVALSVRLSVVMWSRRDFAGALATVESCRHLLDFVGEGLAGKWELNRGMYLRALGRFDEAFGAYTAASVHYARAGERPKLALVLNNIGNLLIDCGRLVDAHDYITRALAACEDEVTAAQFRDTRARAYMEEGRYTEAAAEAVASVLHLEEAGEVEAAKTSKETLREIRRRVVEGFCV